MHLLQLQTPGGLMSNDFIFHVTANAEPPPPPTLGEIVRLNGWSNLIGDWVDTGTRGEFRVSLAWKIKDQLLELTTIDQNGPAVAFIRIDHSSGKVVHSGTNHSGAATSGTWDFAAQDGPKFSGSFLSSEGTSAAMGLQFVPQTEDKLEFRVGTAQTANIAMVRKH